MYENLWTLHKDTRKAHLYVSEQIFRAAASGCKTVSLEGDVEIVREDVICENCGYSGFGLLVGSS